MSSARRLALATEGYRGGNAREMVTVDGAVLVEHIALVDDSAPSTIFHEEDNLILTLDTSRTPL